MKLTIKSTVKSLDQGYQAEATAGEHKVLMDEPVESGGTDKGMNPLELFLSGLGGCQVISAKMFAPAMDFKFDEIRVDVEGDADMDAITGDDPNAYRGISEVRCHYHIKTNESEERVKEFIKFVDDRCPVSVTLKSKIDVVQTGYEIN